MAHCEPPGASEDRQNQETIEIERIIGHSGDSLSTTTASRLKLASGQRRKGGYKGGTRPRLEAERRPRPETSL